MFFNWVAGNGRQNLRQKIDDLLGLCRGENDSIKKDFHQVVGAEREILELMKEELDEIPRFNNGADNYASSNVQMFPGGASVHDYGQAYPQNQGGYEQAPYGRYGGS